MPWAWTATNISLSAKANHEVSVVMNCFPLRSFQLDNPLFAMLLFHDVICAVSSSKLCKIVKKNKTEKRSFYVLLNPCSEL